LKKHKIIYTTFLLTAISCSNFRPYVLTNAYLNPETTTEVNYDDINWSYSLFNQFASGLNYSITLSYSTLRNKLINEGIYYFENGVYYAFTEWDLVQSTVAYAYELSPLWKSRFNKVFFDRKFDKTTKKSVDDPRLEFLKWGNEDTVNFVINIESSISYSVNIGSVFMAFQSAATVDYYKYLTFYNKSNILLQTFLLDTDVSSIKRNYIYELSTIVTNVNRFDLDLQWVDTPPFTTGNSYIIISEFNLFTQNQEIDIPDDTDGNVFGFEFVAVEWWNILGHLQNFAWWIVNKSPISPLFVWIDEYVITWISGLITFLTGVFNL